MRGIDEICKELGDTHNKNYEYISRLLEKQDCIEIEIELCLNDYCLFLVDALIKLSKEDGHNLASCNYLYSEQLKPIVCRAWGIVHKEPFKYKQYTTHTDYSFTEDVEWYKQEMQHKKEQLQTTFELRRMPYADYLKTYHWQYVRSRALESAHNKCQLCYSCDRLEVHHRTYKRRGSELPEDLTVLCHNCHEKFHNKGLHK